MNKRAIYTIASHIFKMNLSIQMMFIISFVLIAGDYLNLTLKSVVYTLSLTLEELLLFAMPGIIFSYLFSCLISFKNKALKLVSFLLVTVSFSNFVSAILAYIFGNFALSRIHLNLQPSPQISRQLLPLWDFELPYMISSERALIIALVLGIIFSIYPSEQIEWTAQKLKKAVNLFLGKIFTPLLPLFILGFILKMQYEGTLITIIQNYGQVFAIIITICIIYIAILYFVAAKFNSKKAYLYLKNTLPSGLMGFATMSSIIAMPVTLRAAKKNTQSSILAETLVPFTVNIHMTGDSLAIPIMAIAILFSLGQPLPTFEQYCLFSVFFVLCRFAVAAVPGGGILIILPILESYLGFSPEMSALITTIFILFDPFATAVNVIGNGGFIILLSQFFRGILQCETKPKAN